MEEICSRWLSLLYLTGSSSSNVAARKRKRTGVLSTVRSTRVYVLICTYVTRRLGGERQVTTVLTSHVLWYFKLSQWWWWKLQRYGTTRLHGCIPESGSLLSGYISQKKLALCNPKFHYRIHKSPCLKLDQSSPYPTVLFQYYRAIYA
jgi:hypothetical protein